MPRALVELTAVIYLFGRYFNLRGWIDDQLVVDKLFCNVLQLFLQRWLLRRERETEKSGREQSMMTNHFQVLAVQAK